MNNILFHSAATCSYACGVLEESCISEYIVKRACSTKKGNPNMIWLPSRRDRDEIPIHDKDKAIESTDKTCHRFIL